MCLSDLQLCSPNTLLLVKLSGLLAIFIDMDLIPDFYNINVKYIFHPVILTSVHRMLNGLLLLLCHNFSPPPLPAVSRAESLCQCRLDSWAKCHLPPVGYHMPHYLSLANCQKFVLLGIFCCPQFYLARKKNFYRNFCFVRKFRLSEIIICQKFCCTKFFYAKFFPP